MTLALTEEQELLRSTAADFVDSEVVPNRARWDRAEAVDREIVEKLGELGFLGLTLAEELGGTGGDTRRTAWSWRSSAAAIRPSAASSRV